MILNASACAGEQALARSNLRFNTIRWTVAFAEWDFNPQIL